MYLKFSIVQTNLRLLSRRTPPYTQRESKKLDAGGDAFETLEGAGILDITNFSLNESSLEAVVFVERQMRIVMILLKLGKSDDPFDDWP